MFRSMAISYWLFRLPLVHASGNKSVFPGRSELQRWTESTGWRHWEPGGGGIGKGNESVVRAEIITTGGNATPWRGDKLPALITGREIFYVTEYGGATCYGRETLAVTSMLWSDWRHEGVQAHAQKLDYGHPSSSGTLFIYFTFLCYGGLRKRDCAASSANIRPIPYWCLKAKRLEWTSCKITQRNSVEQDPTAVEADDLYLSPLSVNGIVQRLTLWCMYCADTFLLF